MSGHFGYDSHGLQDMLEDEHYHDSSFDESEFRQIMRKRRSKRTKPMTKEELSSFRAKRRASWIRLILCGRTPATMLRETYPDAMQANSHLRKPAPEPEHLLYTFLVETAWDSHGPDIAVTARGGTALHLLRDLQPEDHMLWLAVLRSGVDPGRKDLDGRTFGYGADLDFIKCAFHYTKPCAASVDAVMSDYFKSKGELE